MRAQCFGNAQLSLKTFEELFHTFGGLARRVLYLCNLAGLYFDMSRIFGMRHRAAIGLTQETDAVVIVVSEERQDISLAYEGRLFQGMKRDDLLLKVKQLMKPKKSEKKRNAKQD